VTIGVILLVADLRTAGWDRAGRGAGNGGEERKREGKWRKGKPVEDGARSMILKKRMPYIVGKM
jgi:hypothetical protein